MESKRQIDILELVKIGLKEEIGIRCICDILNRLRNRNTISVTEYSHIKMLLVDNKPTRFNQYAEFTKDETWRNCDDYIDDSFWWSNAIAFPETLEIRSNYLDAVISNIK